jgi:hypothetical protein
VTTQQPDTADLIIAYSRGDINATLGKILYILTVQPNIGGFKVTKWQRNFTASRTFKQPPAGLLSDAAENTYNTMATMENNIEVDLAMVSCRKGEFSTFVKPLTPIVYRWIPTTPTMQPQGTIPTLPVFPPQ